MNRDTVVQNLTNKSGKYGITREVLEPLIDDGVKEGFTYDLIYLSLEAELSKLAGQEFFCTSEDMARAFDMPVEEMNRIIEEAREDYEMSVFSMYEDTIKFDMPLELLVKVIKPAVVSTIYTDRIFDVETGMYITEFDSEKVFEEDFNY